MCVVHGKIRVALSTTDNTTQDNTGNIRHDKTAGLAGAAGSCQDKSTAAAEYSRSSSACSAQSSGGTAHSHRGGISLPIYVPFEERLLKS